MPDEIRCPVCASPDVSVFFELSDVPVHIGVQWPDEETARRCPKGDIKMAFCHACGFITNLAFDACRVDYARTYENPLCFSPRFQRYARSVAARLIDRHDLHGKDIIDIGCGKGDFLSLLCELGNNRGVGFDPSHENLAKGNQAAAQVSFIRDFYSEHYANYQADLICCRHALEHIYDPTDFVSMLRRSISDRSKTILYVEVPNVLLILRDLSIWDIIYEHCSYFCRESLAHLFRSCGFDVLDLKEAYEGQFLAVEACPHREASDYERDPLGDLRELSSYVAAFADSYRVKMDSWQSCLDVIEHAGRRAVLWGAGAKAVSFLNTLKAEGRVEYVVDINPRKQGMHIAGTGQRIVPPDFLREYRPDVAIVMNPVYMSEIQGTVAELGLTTELVCA